MRLLKIGAMQQQRNLIWLYKGEVWEYEEVESPTGRIWMDRNLGATQAATAYNDSAAYGDLFQWGRNDDGHQERTSSTTATLSSTDTPGHGFFITNINDPADWRTPQNDNLWQPDTRINMPAPDGWRLPTGEEWNTERLSWVSDNRAGAFASPLKLTVAGSRYINGALWLRGSHGYYYSSTVHGTYSEGLGFSSSESYIPNFFRANGLSVRLIKEL